ncbi:MAG: hypothetical protein FJ387_08800 [Verrucomicrobia bacterium]|nr:hypothetical protein [Verrucomicrobiota bacterium]
MNSATHEALWPTHLFTQGIGWVIVARFKSGGRRTEAGVFLLDVFCLGVKLAIYEATTTPDYQRRIRDHYLASFPMETTEPVCARKVVEQAVQYARSLGFAPHPEYRQAARVFGGLKAVRCPREFTFGYGGKPFYRRGPRETEQQARHIIEHLHAWCGPGNYDYSVILGDAEDINRAFGG